MLFRTTSRRFADLAPKLARSPSFVRALPVFVLAVGLVSPVGIARAQGSSGFGDTPARTQEVSGSLDVETLEASFGDDWSGDSSATAALLAGSHDHGAEGHSAEAIQGATGSDISSALLNLPTSGVRVDLPGDPTMVILEAPAGEQIGTVAVRSFDGAGWSEWIAVADEVEEAPDGLAGEEGSRGGRSGIGPIWIGEEAQAVELARLGEGGSSITIEALSPAGDLALAAQGIISPDEAAALGEAAAQPGEPNVIPRSAWTTAGWAYDNEECDQGPILNRNVEAVVVHHTVTTNSYGADAVASQIEGIRRFHTNTKGWCDIAYNFVIDRFGRIWEARMGGVDKPVSGGHTRGFNTATSGFAVLGTHTSTPSSAAVNNAIAALADWKLGLHGADPLGTVWLKSRTGSTGALLHPNGTWVDSPRLVGHRELVLTACPGNGLQPNIAPIRAQIAQTVDDAPYNFAARNPLDSGPAVFVVDTQGAIRPAGAADVPTNSPSPLGSGSARAVDGANGRGYVLVSDGSVIGFGGNGNPGSPPAGNRAAVDLIASADGSRGWVLDGTGELHGFGGASDRSPSSSPSAAVAAALENGQGYVLGSNGTLHSVGGAPSRSIAATVSAVDLALLPDGESGWVLDNTGRLYPFGDATEWQSDLAGAAGDRARAVLADPTGRGGWVLDSEGRLYSFGRERNVQPITTTVGNPTIVDAGMWWHLPADLDQNKDPAYASALFELFLSRSPTLEELDHWTWVIYRTSRDDVAEEFANSEEWAGVIVDDIYLDVLGRLPEATGRSYWVDRLNEGLRTQDLGALFYSSPEYVQAAGSNTAYVTQLYRALLHREPDAEGIDYWVSRLDSGEAVPGDIASGFYQSVESRNDRVTRLYDAILLRAPDMEGRDFWAGRLLGEDDIALAVDLAISSEFRDRVTAGLD